MDYGVDVVMREFIELKDLDKHDNCSNRIVEVEPDLYINQYLNKRIFVRNVCFDKFLSNLQISLEPSMISPSRGCVDEALEDYSEIIAEPVSSLSENDHIEYLYISSENKYYISKLLFESLFKKNGVDILID
ncbi:hypothetical protein VS_II0981 [Vibrio atlanticus]|uniref:Uncharacterized protein n=1 Tax=Vibrio atlanticus (strain LGP32) TaxID=575788 RepID=B7VTR8_VIBA3|nr:hypothetical protein VS_II0981 [Vibrio atlanticus]